MRMDDGFMLVRGLAIVLMLPRRMQVEKRRTDERQQYRQACLTRQ